MSVSDDAVREATDDEVRAFMESMIETRKIDGWLTPRAVRKGLRATFAVSRSGPSDRQVEAAARGMNDDDNKRLLSDRPDLFVTWEENSDWQRDLYLRLARAALVAAGEVGEKE